MEPRKRKIFHYVSGVGIDRFSESVSKIKDVRGRAAINKRMDRVSEGLLGDHHYLGAGVWELRIDFGPGYRIYYGEDGLAIILLLAGDKGSQTKDIRHAHALWADYRRAQ